jgi:hypothetical protein
MFAAGERGRYDLSVDLDTYLTLTQRGGHASSGMTASLDYYLIERYALTAWTSILILMSFPTTTPPVSSA